MTLQILVWDGYHKETTISSLITEATAYTECRTSIKIPVFQVLIFSPVFIYGSTDANDRGNWTRIQSMDSFIV